MDWQSWQTPSQRQISLYTEQDDVEKAMIEVRAKKATDERQKVIDQHIDRTL